MHSLDYKTPGLADTRRADETSRQRQLRERTREDTWRKQCDDKTRRNIRPVEKQLAEEGITGVKSEVIPQLVLNIIVPGLHDATERL
jgi:hypothetical protein